MDFTMRISASLLRRVKNAARLQGKSASDFIKQAIHEHNARHLARMPAKDRAAILDQLPPATRRRLIKTMSILLRRSSKPDFQR